MCKRVTPCKRELEDMLRLQPVTAPRPTSSTCVPHQNGEEGAPPRPQPPLHAQAPAQPSIISTLGQDVLNLVGEYCHPMELARLALCTWALLAGGEECAALLCRRLPAAVTAVAVAPVVPATASTSTTTATPRSWRYRYLCAFEVAGVEAPRLKTALQHIYSSPKAAATPVAAATHLNLYGVGMGDAGAERLALALRVVRAYRVLLLNLGGNNLSDKGAQVVVAALRRHHQEVDTLFLAQNRIGADGARCVADLISSSATLRSVSLSDNPITDEGALSITGALPESTSLATLSMRCASVSTQAREDIRSTWGGRGGNTVFGLYI